MFDDWFAGDNSIGAGVSEEDINWDQTPEERAEQEFLGQSILESSLEGQRQEELGRGIVQESIGRSLVDEFVNGSRQVEPWLRSLDATLGATSRSITQVDRLLGRTSQVVAPSGIPRELQQRDRITPVLNSVRRYLTVTPPSGNTSLGTRRTSQFSATFDGGDYVTIGVVALGAFLLYRALK